MDVELWKLSSLSPKKLGEFLLKNLKSTGLLQTNKHD